MRHSLDMRFEGSDARAVQYKKLMVELGACISLLTRIEPLCDHERAAYVKHYETYATEYASLWPESEMHPKGYMMGYEVPDQMDETGTSGQFGEGPIESTHVRDNELWRRNHNIREKEAFVRSRAKSHLAMTCPAIKNIRTSDHRRSYAQRQRANDKSRQSRFVISAQRLAHEGQAAA